MALPFLDTAQRSRRLRRGRAGMVALAVAAARRLGGSAARPGEPAAAGAPPTRRRRRRPAAQRSKPTWVPADAAPLIQGAQAFAPAPGLSARAMLVHGEAVDATLVPAALRGDAPSRACPRRRRATLGGLAAWNYGPIRDKHRVIEVTVAPTTAACSPSPARPRPRAGAPRSAALDGVHAVTLLGREGAHAVARPRAAARRRPGAGARSTRSASPAAPRSPGSARRPRAAWPRRTASPHRARGFAATARRAEVVAALRDVRALVRRARRRRVATASASSPRVRRSSHARRVGGSAPRTAQV